MPLFIASTPSQHDRGVKRPGDHAERQVGHERPDRRQRTESRQRDRGRSISPRRISRCMNSRAIGKTIPPRTASSAEPWMRASSPGGTGSSSGHPTASPSVTTMRNASAPTSPGHDGPAALETPGQRDCSDQIHFFPPRSGRLPSLPGKEIRYGGSVSGQTLWRGSSGPFAFAGMP